MMSLLMWIDLICYSIGFVGLLLLCLWEIWDG